MELKHVLSSQQFSKEFLYDIFKKADEFREHPRETLKGKILAVLFYEPSTRTRLSFESAMLKLGGNIIGTENAREFSSVSKGESLKDTIRNVANYVDGIVIRHNIDGAALEASEVSRIPVINAGDGKGQHPTQALLDLYTIYREIGKLDNLNITIVGDLACGRTVRSLSYLLAKFEGTKINFISPSNLKVGDDIKNYLNKHQVQFKESENLEEVLPNSDVIYMTRIQKERMSAENYEKAKGKFIIDEKNLNLIPRASILMHPLPHLEEINLPIEIENQDKRVAYFRQSENGLYLRIALLDLLMNKNY